MADLLRVTGPGSEPRPRATVSLIGVFAVRRHPTGSAKGLDLALQTGRGFLQVHAAPVTLGNSALASDRLVD